MNAFESLVMAENSWERWGEQGNKVPQKAAETEVRTAGTDTETNHIHLCHHTDAF